MSDAKSGSLLGLARAPGGGPALLNLGRGDVCAVVGDVSLASDGARVWATREERAFVLDLEGLALVAGAPDRLELHGATEILELAPHDNTVVRRAREVSAAVCGQARVEIVDEAFVVSVAPTVRCVDVLSRGERVLLGPLGAILIGDADGWWRAGAPGRTPRTLSAPLMPTPIFFAADGATVAGHEIDGGPVRVHLRSGATEGVPGSPVSSDAWLDAAGVLYGPSGCEARGWAETSCARVGWLLAGPGGVCWDLRTGRRCFDTPVLGVGLTVAGPDELAPLLHIPWPGDRGWLVDPVTGRIERELALPLDDDDPPLHGVCDGPGFRIATSGRVGLHIGARATTGCEAPRSPPRPRIEGALARWIPRSTTHRFDSVRALGGAYAWSDDGWLVWWPDGAGAPPGTSSFS